MTIRRERVPWEIWKTFTVSKGRRYERFAFTHPETRKRVTYSTEAAARKARADAHRSLHERELRLVGRAQERFTRFGRLCFTYQIDEDRALDLLEQTLATRREAPPVATPVIVAELLDSLKRQRKSDYYLGPLKLRLGRFAEQFPGPLAYVTDAQVRSWLDSLELGPVTFNHYRAAVLRLVSFAVDRKYLPPSHTFHVETVEAPDHEPSTFTPTQLRLVLEHISPSALPAILLGAFAGLRPIETLRIRWEAIDWEDNTLTAPRAKKKDTRQVPLLPNLRAWLQSPDVEGPRSGRMVNMGFSGLTQACARAVRKANAQLAALGVKDPLQWDADILRHSFGSYRWGIVRNLHQVVEEMGNSARTFKKHYRRLIPRAQAKAWFEIHPDGLRGNLIQGDFLHSILPQKPVLSPPQQRRNHA